MLGTVFRSMLITSLKDKISLFYALLFPIILLIGLGLFIDSPVYHQTLLYGTLAISTLFWGLSGIAFQVHQQRSQGVYKLIKLTPFPTLSFILTMALARTVLAIIINGIVYLFGAIFLNQPITVLGTLSIFAVIAVGALCFSCIGFFVSNVSKNEGQISMISNLLFIPMIFASEVFYSLEHAPAWIKGIGQLFPMGYFVQGLQTASVSNSILLSLGVLLAFTCGWALLAAATFRWDDQSSPLFAHLRRRKENESL